MGPETSDQRFRTIRRSWVRAPLRAYYGRSSHLAVRLCILPNSAGGFAASWLMTREDICSSVKPRVSRVRNVKWSPSMRFRSLSDRPSALKRRSSFIDVIVNANFGESFGSNLKNARRGTLRKASHDAYMLSVEFAFEPEFDSVLLASANLLRYNFLLASACEMTRIKCAWS